METKKITREEAIRLLAEADSEAAADTWTPNDFYDLFAGVMTFRPYNAYTNVELVEELNDLYSDDQEPSLFEIKEG